MCFLPGSAILFVIVHREANDTVLRGTIRCHRLVSAQARRRCNVHHAFNGMDRLLRVPQNPEQIKSELALAETQWLFLKHGIDRLNANKTSGTELEFVAKSCDNILEVMERVTKLYESMKG